MEKQRREESVKRRTEERRSEKRKRQKKEDAGARKGRKVAKHCVCPMICGSGGSKSRLAKAGARWEMKSCTPGWREAHLEVKMYKTHHSQTTFGSWDVEKVHAVLVRSTCGSQNVQCYKTPHVRTTFGSWDVKKVHAVRLHYTTLHNATLITTTTKNTLHYTTLQLITLH